MSDRDAAISTAHAIYDTGRFQAELAKLVAYPTESQNPDHAAVLDAYLREAITPLFEAMQFEMAVYPNPDKRGGPLLVASRIEDEKRPTILCYGHGDVVHGQGDAWRNGLKPFELKSEGERLYGRGSADNKSQHLINLLALRAVIEMRGTLGFNIRFLMEMSEETGSLGLEEFCRNNGDLLAADLLIASDGPRLQADMPTVFTGARGGIGFDLEVNLREGAHHSGNWGGLLADPAIILTHALATITDKRGQLAIPEWRPTSLTPEIRAALENLPIDDATGPAINPDWGEVGLTPAERAFGWNSFSVLAMKSGVPDAPANAISGNATASCQLRFVVGTDPGNIVPSLRRHLDEQGFQCVEIIESDNGFFPATRLSPGHPWVDFTLRSIATTTGKEPHLLPNLAGSLPNHCFSEILNMSTIWIPHSYRGCSQHAPNEHVLKSVCREGLEIMAGLFWDIGELKTKLPDREQPSIT